MRDLALAHDARSDIFQHANSYIDIIPDLKSPAENVTMPKSRSQVMAKLTLHILVKSRVR